MEAVDGRAMRNWARIVSRGDAERRAPSRPVVPRGVLAVASMLATVVCLAACGSSAQPVADDRATTAVEATTGEATTGEATVEPANTVSPAQPSSVAGTPGQVGRFVAVGVFHGCAVDRTLVECWGANEHGQLGRGHTGDGSSTEPVQDLSGVTAIAAGDQHTCALVGRPGEVWCWGMNEDGQLGLGDLVDRTRPFRAVGIEDAVMLTAGDFHTCAVSGPDRGVWCWGMNISGQVGGAPSDEPVTAPRRVDDLSEVVAIDAGFAHTCAVTADGMVTCWGDDIGGQSGGAAPGGRAVIEGVDDAVDVRVGMYESCVIVSDRTVRCWGQDEQGRFGAGIPSVLDQLGSADALAVGSGHVCALAGGTVRCLGATGGTMPGISAATAVDANHWSVCAVDSEGVGCWNYEVDGDLVRR